MSEVQHEKGAAFNTQPAGLEKWIDETLNKKSPVQLPAGGRQWLADNAWWLTLVGGILSLWGAWNYWQAGHFVDRWSDYADQLARALGTPTYGSSLGAMWYIALAAMAVQGVLYLMAFQSLKEHKKSGWNLLFYASLVALAMGVVYIFVPSYGVSSALGVAIGAVIGWFLLFQVRSHFTK